MKSLQYNDIGIIDFNITFDGLNQISHSIPGNSVFLINFFVRYISLHISHLYITYRFLSDITIPLHCITLFPHPFMHHLPSLMFYKHEFTKCVNRSCLAMNISINIVNINQAQPSMTSICNQIVFLVSSDIGAGSDTLPLSSMYCIFNHPQGSLYSFYWF